MLSFLNRTFIAIILCAIVLGVLAYYKHKASSLENATSLEELNQIQIGFTTAYPTC